MANEPAPGGPGAKDQSPARSGFHWRWVEASALPILFAVIVGVFAIAESSSFITVGNASSVLGTNTALVGVMAAALVPLIVGEFDLSVGATSGLAAMVTAVLNGQHHWPVLLAALVAVLAGAACGGINAFFVVLLDNDSFIVTLGVGTAVTGAVYWMSSSETVAGISTTMSNWVFTKTLFGIPLEFYYGLALCFVLWLVFEFTRAGRLLLIVGQGRAVARLSGIRVSRVRIMALTASGFVAAWAGVLYAGTSGAADPTSGTQLMLPAFAGAFLGATTIKPGRFNAWGSLVAVYFLVTGVSGLQMLGVADYVQDLFYGGALVIAVSLSQLSRRRQLAESAVH